jgi:hypothetical protein
MRRVLIAQGLKDELQSTMEERIDRLLETERGLAVANHHFSAAAAECIRLYRDGYFISVVMVSQVVNEGMMRFVAEANSISLQVQEPGGKTRTKGVPDLIDEFRRAGVLSQDCADASCRICGSFRNDVHHMNPKVDSVPFRQLAKRNLHDLSVIEAEIFGSTFSPDGRINPKRPNYWTFRGDGMVSTFLRMGPEDGGSNPFVQRGG